jgi:hypothetical protein
MSTKYDDYVKVKERFPYHGKGKEELLTALRRLLSLPENKYVQRIVLEVDATHIYMEKYVPAEEAGKQTKISLRDVVRNKIMEEYESDKAQTPLSQLFDMFSIIQKEGLEVGFIAIGDKTNFQRWLGVRIPITNMSLFGIPIEVIEIPETTFILCGTPERSSEPDDVKFSLKGNIPDEANNRKTP